LRRFPGRSEAAGGTKTHKIEQARVGGDLVFGGGYSRLVSTNLEVGVAGIRRHRDPCPEPSRFGGFGFGARGFGASPQAAEKVNFPARADPEIEQRLVSVKAGQVLSERADRTFERLAKLRCLARQI
jgi:hypothetical protein